MPAETEDDPPHLDDATAIEVSPEALSGETLGRVIEAFVLREGTDYGAHEVPLAVKVEQVLNQLRRGEARILFDPASSSVDIVPSRPPRR